eukprot:1837189-Rhodomonas_salina.1
MRGSAREGERGRAGGGREGERERGGEGERERAWVEEAGGARGRRKGLSDFLGAPYAISVPHTA